MFVLPAIRQRKAKTASVGVRVRRERPEARLQDAVVNFLSVALEGNTWFGAIPLGGGGEARGRTLKRTGSKRGTPDMLVICDGRAIWFELKAPKGRVSEAQEYCHAQLRRARSPVYIVRSIEDVEAALRAAGVPLRATTETRVTERIREGLIAAGVVS